MANDDTTDTIRIRLTVDATYVLHGADPDDLLCHLHKEGMRAISDGLLTGGHDIQVEQYEIDEAVLPDAPSEDELIEYMKRRISDGGLSLEDIHDQLARYGLMESHAFIAEMRERMGLDKALD
ncbi:hypothetical protein ACIU0H_28510 [Pseudomonas aeruginosa]